jgi:hypothetical protein
MILMSAKESITSFFRRMNLVGPKRDRTFIGKLDGTIVASRKPVIIFEYPHIRHVADTVEDATTFLTKLNEAKTANQAEIYLHDTDRWQKLNAPRQ